jgi:hypothetical protein
MLTAEVSSLNGKALLAMSQEKVSQASIKG